MWMMRPRPEVTAIRKAPWVAVLWARTKTSPTKLGLGTVGAAIDFIGHVRVLGVGVGIDHDCFGALALDVAFVGVAFFDGDFASIIGGHSALLVRQGRGERTRPRAGRTTQGCAENTWFLEGCQDFDG